MVTAAVMAILVSVSSDPVDDFLVLTPLTLLLSITVDVLSGGGRTLVSTEKKGTTVNLKNKQTVVQSGQKSCNIKRGQ